MSARAAYAMAFLAVFFLSAAAFAQGSEASPTAMPVVADLGKKTPLNAFLMRITEPAEGAYAGLAASEDGFIPYDGGKLPPPEPGFPLRMITFRHRFAVDPALAGQDIYLFQGPAEYPLTVRLNGVLVFRVGEYRGRYDGILYASRKVLLPRDALRMGENLLAIEAFPTYQRVALPPMYLSGYETVARHVFLRTILNQGAPQAAVIFAVIIGLYFLFLFGFTGRSQTKYLAFAFLCFLYSLAYWSFYMHEGANELAVFKISRVGLFLVVAALGVFIVDLTGILRRRWFLIPYALVFGAAPATAILVQGSVRGIMGTFASLSSFTITPVLLFSLALTAISVFKDHKWDYLYILGAILLVAAAGVRDLSYLNNDITPSFWMVSYAYVVLLMTVFLLLAREQSVEHFGAIEKARRLDESNGRMSELVNRIMGATNRLLEGSAVLERNVAQAAAVAEEYRRTNEDVNAKVSDQLDGMQSVAAELSAQVRTSGERIPQALANQTTAIEGAARNADTMNRGIEGVLASTIQSAALAERLAELAARSAQIVERNRKSVEEIHQRSRFLEDVMQSIEDISERTSILAINASIESARAGSAGKGFNVVAGEIRTLSDLSRSSLDSSFEKLQEMFAEIQESAALSQEAAQHLSSIIAMSRESAGAVESIEALVKEQKAKADDILSLARGLEEESTSIRELSDADQGTKVRTTELLSASVSDFASIREALAGQQENERKITEAIDAIRLVMEENLEDIRTLRELSGRGGEG